MAQRLIRHEVTCPYCEGTKHSLNFFDPLENQLPHPMIIDREKRAPSGRIMYDWKCEECIEGKIIFYEIIKQYAHK